ncbi:ribosome biogenesis protein [Holotrichia oblita]|uniref:Ribosome biogenesis protein n=1 Tax=Holotrichia oblita TaxID=644536 RepID=A0ACB9TFB0_HOLOL|nr:ribosome biogenesis protein [Holotrichia oblita]
MAIEKPQVHRPGPFKQTNKPHKHGQHRSKGSINIATKGKVSVKSISRKRKVELNRSQRRHQSLQIRQNKRDEVLLKKRSLGGFESAPLLLCVVPLNKDFDPASAILKLTKCDSEAVVSTSASGVIHISIPKFKQRFAIVIPSINDDFAILDTMKVANTVLFMVSGENGVNYESELIDSWGTKLLLTSFSQGLSTPIVAIADLDNIPVKKRNDQKQAIQKQISKWFPDEKVISLEKPGDELNLLRKIGNQKQKAVTYRDRRPHLYAENVEYLKKEESNVGTLKVSGYLRGIALSVNNLVYVPGLGTYQMSQIDAPTDPYSIEKKKHVNDQSTMNDAACHENIKILETEDTLKQESLQSENIPDSMDAEQTWPTEEEIKDAQEEQKQLKKVKKVPKGWSSYQAAWIPDHDAEFISDNTDGDSENEFMDAISDQHSEYSDAEDNMDTVTESEILENDQQYDAQFDFATEQADLEKLKEAKSDLMFPDEVDTPQHLAARVRFQKYRGLESFRTSPWDPKENLPIDYAKIFQFENFDRTRRRVIKELEDREGALPGWYITLHLKNVPETVWNAFVSTNRPLVVFGLLPHENKMSVVNVVLRRTNLLEEPLKSKERLIFQCGYRRYIVNPIFSQHTNGNKHKFERFFQPDSTAVASFFAPIQFPPSPVLCYKEINGSLVLVATGNILSCNPDRIIIKRVVLSGHLFKVHKKSAVVRFMFFNRDDILYFKPCKLRTKYGRTGHIKEPLGTHGHMKCVFDGQIKSQDTVLLNLYKRVFPKWKFDECIASCSDNQTSNSMDL